MITLCPKCGKAIARVDASDIPTNSNRSEINFDAVCFSCPLCHSIIDIAPDSSVLEPTVANIQASVGDVHSEVSNLKAAFQRFRTGHHKKKKVLSRPHASRSRPKPA
jgi:hypothetical protein